MAAVCGSLFPNYGQLPAARCPELSAVSSAFHTLHFPPSLPPTNWKCVGPGQGNWLLPVGKLAGMWETENQTTEPPFFSWTVPSLPPVCPPPSSSVCLSKQQVQGRGWVPPRGHGWGLSVGNQDGQKERGRRKQIKTKEINKQTYICV